MAITPPKALVPAAVLVWSGLAVAMLSASQQRAGARQGEPVLAMVPSSLRFDEASKAEPVHPFESRWDDAMPDDQPLLKKQDRLPLATMADVVITERITSAPTAPVIVSPVVMLADEDKPAAPHRRHVMNVCVSHGMHKVAIRGGKSWRCRK